MPTYDYECKSCGYRFEASQKITDKPLQNCPKCKKKVNRLISSGSGIIFKGSGFYATDYRSKDYRDKKAKEKGAPACDSASKKEECKTCPRNKK